MALKFFGKLNNKPVAKSCIAGKWVVGRGKIFEVRTPITNEIIGYSHDCSVGQVEQAFAAAKEAQFYWFLRVNILEKEAIYRKTEELLEKYRPQLVSLITKEMGKTAVTADADVTEFIHCVQHYHGELSRIEGGVKDCQMSDKSSTWERHPFGTVLAICPWNFFAIPSWKIFGSITAGNACVLKISKETPFMASFAVCLINEAIKAILGEERYSHLAGLVQLIHGGGSTTGEILLDQGEKRAYDLISFTGGVETGRHVAERAGSYLIPCHLELGGHGTIVVMDDFDISKAVNEIVLAAFGDAGQRCVSTKEVLIEETIFDKVGSGVVEKVQKLIIGDPRFVETNIGPLISFEQREIVHKMVLKTAEKTKPIMGGYCITEKTLGAFYAPTVFVNAPRDAFAMQHEIFGPVLCLTKLLQRKTKEETLAEAVKIINNKGYGLSNGLLTNDVRLRYLAGKLIKTGILYRGRGTTGAELGCFFGGVGFSGWGREGRGIESFSYIKQIYDDYYPETRLAQVGSAKKLKKMLKNSKPLIKN